MVPIQAIKEKDRFVLIDGFCATGLSRPVADNTHVIVAAGVGPDAIITSEMEHFGRMYQHGWTRKRSEAQTQDFSGPSPMFLAESRREKSRLNIFFLRSPRG